MDDREQEARAEQARVLRAAADRLSAGDPALPVDIFEPVVAELERRADAHAITEALEEQGKQPPSAFDHPLLPRGKHAIADVRLFARAARDLTSLSGDERRVVEEHIASIAGDTMPRGALPLPDRHGGHLRVRAQGLRVLYRVRGEMVDIVAITRGP